MSEVVPKFCGEDTKTPTEIRYLPWTSLAKKWPHWRKIQNPNSQPEGSQDDSSAVWTVAYPVLNPMRLSGETLVVAITRRSKLLKVLMASKGCYNLSASLNHGVTNSQLILKSIAATIVMALRCLETCSEVCCGVCRGSELLDELHMITGTLRSHRQRTQAHGNFKHAQGSDSQRHARESFCVIGLRTISLV